jgi:UTP--glucose-1-phosphate uridylyltransferase
MRRGEVGAVILAGGMATRFGGVVKAAVEVLDGQSFLELKLKDLAAVA